jgi:PAS domain S-box-containing protein
VGMISVARDITLRMRAEEKLRDSERKSRELFDFLPIPVYEMDLESKMTSANRAIFEAFRGTEKDLEKGIKVSQLLSPQDAEKSSQNIQRMLRGERIEGTEYILKRLDGTSFPAIVISSIIHENDKPVGLRGAVVDITERKKSEDKLQQTLDSLNRAVRTTIQVMVSAVEARDPYTSGHQFRSADLAQAIALEMGLGRDKIDAIRAAASIHDIGKLSVPAEILSKPTKLTKIEFSLIQAHSQKGFEILKDVESPWPLAEIVYQHHERMDGTGYPRNLKGDEILMEARILTAADVVEAMASHRPYRASLGIEAALKEMETNRGIFYDKDVVDACLRLFREKGYRLPEKA